MVSFIYLLCASTSLLCTWLLFRNYRKTSNQLLFWSALCFAALTANNAILILDKLLFTQISLLAWRELITMIALSLLIFGLIWRTE